MNILFEEEGTTVFAVAYDEVIDRYQYNELLIAEINPRLGAYEVRFESAWDKPIYCDDLDKAKRLVLSDYWKYKATSVRGNVFLGG